MNKFNPVVEFCQYTWNLIKEDFRAQLVPIKAIRNWLKRNSEQ